MPARIPHDVAALIAAIRSDNRSGAVQLTRRASEAIVRLAREAPCSSARNFRDALAGAARALIAAQPAMAPVFNLANAALLSCEDRRDLEAARQSVEMAAREFLSKLDRAGDAVAQRAAALVQDGMTVLTHSYSDTVLNSLLSAAKEGRRFEAICTESRPVSEGALLAGRLAAAGVPATLITDAAVLSELPNVRIVFTGADAVTAGGLVNKTGTSLVALAARQTGTPVYALCGSEKFLPSGYTLPPEPPKDPKEILGADVPGVSVRNLYFDRTPLAWFTGFVTESGIETGAALRKRLGRMRVHPALAGAVR